MKKNIILSILAGTLIFSFCSCKSNSPAPSHPSTKPISLGDVYYPAGIPETAAELEEKCDIMVQGILLEGSEEIKETMDLGLPEPLVTYGATISPLEITKVIKGNLKVGDIINLEEPYYKKIVDGKETTVIFAGGEYMGLYNPCQIGKEYLLCLDEFNDIPDHPSDTYGLMWRELGRYPVISPLSRFFIDVDSMTNEDLDFREGDATAYKEIYKGVIDSYMR